MKYRLAILDFDGTLADSFPFFIAVFNRLAEQHGFGKIAADRVAALRRYDARRLMRHMQFPAWKLPRVARSFTRLMTENAPAVTLFDGVAETLRHLAGTGVVLAVVTSNSRENVSRVLGPANMDLIAHLECGMSVFGKAARIRRVLRRCAIDRREAIYIGDQFIDGEAARHAGVAFGAVAWGYGAIESMRVLRPEEEFSRVSEIGRIA